MKGRTSGRDEDLPEALGKTATEMVYRVKALATESRDLSWIPRTNCWKELTPASCPQTPHKYVHKVNKTQGAGDVAQQFSMLCAGLPSTHVSQLTRCL